MKSESNKCYKKESRARGYGVLGMLCFLEKIVRESASEELGIGRALSEAREGSHGTVESSAKPGLWEHHGLC